MIVADLRGRDLSRFARSAHSSSRSSAASLLHREPLECNARLARLVECGAAPTITTLLQGGTPARLLERGSSDEQDEAGEAIRGCYAHYENHALLARARIHDGALMPVPVAPPAPAAALLQPYIAPDAAR
ncbi:MAG: hypothetical protein ACRYGL_05405 [Janthinobacterium lividum]